MNPQSKLLDRRQEPGAPRRPRGILACFGLFLAALLPLSNAGQATTPVSAQGMVHPSVTDGVASFTIETETARSGLRACSSTFTEITPCNDVSPVWKLPTESGTYSFTVRNKKTTARHYTLSCIVTTPLSNCAVVGPTGIWVSGGATAFVSLSYTVGSGTGTGTLTLQTFDDNEDLTGSKAIGVLSPTSVQVTVGSGPSQIDPGQATSYAFSVANSSGSSATYTFAATCSPSFVTSCTAPSSITLASGTSQTVNVGITGGTGGESGTVELRATDTRHSGVGSSATSPEIEVTEQFVVVGPKDRSVTGNPGTSNTLRFTVFNGGETPATFNTVASCFGLGVSGCSAPGSVSVGAGVTTMIAVMYTGASQLGETGQVGLTASQQGATDVADSATAFVTISAATPVPEIAIMSPQNAVARDLCVTVAVGSGGAVECGDLRLAHGLPAVKTKNKVRAPALLYNSQHADPQPVVSADITPPSQIFSRPDRIEATVQIIGGAAFSDAWTETPTSGGVTRRIAIPVDVGSGPSTQLAQYTLGVTTVHGLNRYADTVSGALIVVDRRSSPFGRGWWLAGLEQLHPLSGNRRLWIGGDGSVVEYVPAGTGVWVGAAIDRPDTLRADGTEYTRILPHGARVRFDSAGLHVATINRLNDTTMFAYETGRLRWMTLPRTSGGLAYTYEFKYDGNNHLYEVVAPAGRVTRLTTDASGFVRTVRDPDSTVVGFDDGGSLRITSRTDRRGNVTRFAYDAAGRFARDTTLMSAAPPIIHRVLPAEVRGLTSMGNTASIDADSAFTEITSPRSDAIVTRILLDGLGAPRRVHNALGHETTIIRADTNWPALVTRVRSQVGRVVSARYDVRGNIIESTDSSTFRDDPGGRTYATTRYEWKAPFDFIRRVTLPEGEITTFDYDTLGNRLWQQPGDTSVHLLRTRFTYDARGLVRAIVSDSAMAGDGVIVDSVFYDGLDNVSETRSPLGFRSQAYKDALGRDTLVVSPIDVAGTQYRQQRFVYDSAGQDTLNVVSAGGESITLRKHYDAEGNLDTLRQIASPDINSIGWMTFISAYDQANRRVADSLVGTRKITFAYDQAGNQVNGGRAGEFTITYDELDRPIRRVGGPLATFRYDVAGNLVGANNPFARVSRRYNLNGSLMADTLRISAIATNTAEIPNGDFSRHVYDLTYRYDLNGRRVWMRHPTSLSSFGGDTVVYGYDPVARGVALLDDVVRDQYRYRYDHLGQVTRLTRRANRPDSVVETLTYSRGGQIVSRREVIGSTVLHDEALSYDARGKLLSDGTTVQQYSALGALTMVDGGQEQFTVDALGNRRDRIQIGDLGPDVHENYAYEVGTGRLLWSARQATSERSDTTRFATNHYGQVNDNFTTRTWPDCPAPEFCNPAMSAKELRRTVSNFNAENKLVRTTFLLDTVPAPNSQYTSYVSDEYYGYDALGRRVWVRAVRGPNCITHDRSSGCRSTMTRTVWDGSQVLHEIQTPGAINDPSLEVDNNHVGYTHGLGIDQPLAIAKNGALAVIPFTNSWGRVDKATCPVALCQNSQLWIPGANEGAFGEAPAPLDGPPSWYGSLIEGGRDASGLMYRRNRYYDSGTGRFTQEDPIGLAGGLNLYGYAGGDPVNYGDPFGLCSKEDGWKEPCWRPTDLRSWKSWKTWFANAWSGRAAGTGPADPEQVLRDAAGIVGAVGGVTKAAAMAAAARRVAITARSGNVVLLQATGGKQDLEVIANMSRNGDVILLDQAHIEGAGPGTTGILELMEYAREFGRQQGATRVIIQGARRTTGRQIGQVPSPIIVDIPPTPPSL